MMISQNGILIKTEESKQKSKLTEYEEKINLIITEELIEREKTPKEEPMIKSLYDKIAPEKLEWVSQRRMCDEDEIEAVKLEDNIYLYINTIDGYEFKVKVDNQNVAIVKKDRQDKNKNVFVTYDANDGEGAQIKVEVAKGETINLIENDTFTNSDTKKEFAGWSTDSSGNEKIYEVNDEYKVNENITFYAIWKEYIIINLYNGGDIGSENAEPIKVEKGKTFSVPNCPY